MAPSSIADLIPIVPEKIYPNDCELFSIVAVRALIWGLFSDGLLRFPRWRDIMKFRLPYESRRYPNFANELRRFCWRHRLSSCITRIHAEMSRWAKCREN